MGIAGKNGNDVTAGLRLPIDDRSPNSKGKGIEIAAGKGGPNYVGSATGQHGLEQFRIDNLNGNYGLHSPKEKDNNNRNLLMLLQGQQVQEEREIQFGSLPKQWEQLKPWAGILGNKNGGKLSYIPPTLVNGQP
ncbi:hypothetical protein FRX31_014358, partial [Thalictrum thalictroides]